MRACAVETHVKISQEPLHTEIYRKNAGAQSEHPDQALVFTLTVRTPQCGRIWGKYQDVKIVHLSRGEHETCSETLAPLRRDPLRGRHSR